MPVYNLSLGIGYLVVIYIEPIDLIWVIARG